ncbi:hypothetical protein V9T40_003820 [Parthenolecanium corni]|uniref:RanBD1 domain-containing protein n=1 Tax=Parthenolecanium corni TaxID=536013 RepID=A0AAN9TTG2_9HEMI
MASLKDNNELKSESALEKECSKDLEENEPSNGEKCKSSVVTANICGTNHTINICSPVGLSSTYKPVIGAGRSILKPSALFTDANVSTPSVTFGNHASKGVKLKPSVLANPFANSSSQIPSNEVKSNSAPSETITSSQTTESQNEETNNSTQPTPLFVPLTNSTSNSSTNHVSASSPSTLVTPSTTFSTSDTLPSTSTNPLSSAFVFGQNLHERVSIEKDDVKETVSPDGSTFSDMLFSAAIQQDKEKASVSHELSNGSSKTLSASAKEYEEARSVKRKYEEVAVVTGEEDEQNILQINCKLFAFDNTLSNWTERGRGTLRVNDKDTPEGRSSRLVMRLLGNLRVVLNTKVWSDMNVELVSQKSVRLTAIDSDGQVRIYLVTAQPKDADQLHNVLTNRIQKKKLKLSSSEENASDVKSS